MNFNNFLPMSLYTNLRFVNFARIFFQAALVGCFFREILLRILTGKKAPSNKTPVLMESWKMDIGVDSTSNQLFMRGSYTEKKFPKIYKVFTDKAPF